MQFETTMQQLSEGGLIGKDDIAVFAQEAPSTAAAVWGGAIGAALSSTNRGSFLIAVNGDRIKLFDIDKGTGAYLGTSSTFEKAELKKVAVSTFLQKQVTLVSPVAKISLLLPYKLRGYKQKERVTEAIAFLKEHYKR